MRHWGIVGLLMLTGLACEEENKNCSEKKTTTLEDVLNVYTNRWRKRKEREYEKIRPVIDKLERNAYQISELRQDLEIQKQEIKKLEAKCLEYEYDK